jgi:hypothetical protein
VACLIHCLVVVMLPPSPAASTSTVTLCGRSDGLGQLSLRSCRRPCRSAALLAVEPANGGTRPERSQLISAWDLPSYSFFCRSAEAAGTNRGSAAQSSSSTGWSTTPATDRDGQPLSSELLRLSGAEKTFHACVSEKALDLTSTAPRTGSERFSVCTEDGGQVPPPPWLSTDQPNRLFCV